MYNTYKHIVRAGKLAALVVALQAIVACDEVVAPSSASSACEINAPRELLPDAVPKIRLGMSLAALRHLLGKPAYSPVAGRHYFLIGGMCPVSPGADILTNCAVIADFRRFDYGSSPQNVVTDALQSCEWSAINE